MNAHSRPSRFATSVWSLALVAALAGACSGGAATPVAGTPKPVGTSTPAAPTAAQVTAAAPTTGPVVTQASSAAGGSSLGQTVATVADLGKALGPGDFAAVGLTGAGPGSVNSNEPGSAYVVYAGKSSATGGIEYDAFTSDTVADAQSTYQTVMEGMLDSTGMGKRDVPTADEAAMRLDNPIDGGGTYASVAVRKGVLVFDIGIPGSPTAEVQLTALALIVLQRTVAVQ